MTTRRGFLGAILAAGVAPAFVGSNVLMPVKKLWTPPTTPYAIDFLPQDLSTLPMYSSVWLKKSRLDSEWQKLTVTITPAQLQDALHNKGPSVEQLILPANGILA